MMNLGENIRSAWNGIWSNKLRSILTMLGIIIGIASVIGITTVGGGLENSVMSSMNSLGANNVTFMVQSKHSGNAASMDVSSMMAGSGVTMKQKDMVSDDMLDALQKHYPSEIKSIGLSETAGTGNASHNGKKTGVMLTGINHSNTAVENVKILKGRTISKAEEGKTAYFAVISSRVAKELYHGDNAAAVGKTIRTAVNGKSYTFTIVGVYKYEESQVMSGQSGSSGQKISTQMYIPMKTAKKISGADSGYSTFTVKTRTSEDSEKFAKSAEKYLNSQYYKGNKDFHLAAFSMDTMLDAMQDMMGKIELALALIAGISLLVGGIGVMNIMLVSVTERTREIGIRKAIGATNGEIRLQFAIESIIICLIGGAIGIVLGGIIGSVGSAALGFKTVMSLKSILLAVGVSFAIGISFGLYPAGRAARLNPIDALRFE